MSVCFSRNAVSNIYREIKTNFMASLGVQNFKYNFQYVKTCGRSSLCHLSLTMNLLFEPLIGKKIYRFLGVQIFINTKKFPIIKGALYAVPNPYIM